MPDIRTRVKNDCTRMEEAFWNALSSAHPSDALMPLLAPECVLNFPGSPILSSDTDPTIKEIISDPQQFKRWDNFGIEDVRVVVLDLMAAVVCYRVSASRGEKIYRALCATTWRQDSDGEWRCCCHAQTPSNY